MCIMCKIAKAAGEAEKQNREVIGAVSPKLLDDFKAHALAKANAQLDVDQMVLDGRRAYINGQATEEETRARQEEIDAKVEANESLYDGQYEALWERVYEEMGLVGEERDRGYSIDHDTGEVSTKRRALRSVPGGRVH